jgi:hypothetical protein
MLRRSNDMMFEDAGQTDEWLAVLGEGTHSVVHSQTRRKRAIFSKNSNKQHNKQLHYTYLQFHR